MLHDSALCELTIYIDIDINSYRITGGRSYKGQMAHAFEPGKWQLFCEQFADEMVCLSSCFLHTCVMCYC